MRSTTNHAQRLITLWIAWLLAMLFHVDLGLMPLFHGQSPEIHSQIQAEALPLLFGAMLGYFLLPLIAIVLIAYADTAAAPASRWRPWRRLHFWFSVVLMHPCQPILELLFEALLRFSFVILRTVQEKCCLFGMIKLKLWY